MSETQNRIPLVALIGLPNSGKSTLINKIIGGNKAITDKVEHTTRDLLYGEDVWNDMLVKYVDTGGLVPNPEDKIQKMIQIKSWQAIAEADLLLWVIDRKQNPETISDLIIQKIWKTGKPCFVLINKVDDPNLEKSIADYARLGPEFFINISASNGYGLGDLMDAITNKLQEMGFEKNTTSLAGHEPFDDEKPAKGKRAKVVTRNPDGTYSITYEENTDKQAGDVDWDNATQVTAVHEFPSLRLKDWRSKPIKVALLGKPNVGKSSLFNAIVGKEIQIVTEIPGTTLSVNDTLFERVLPKKEKAPEDNIKIENLVFDFGNVIYDFDKNELIKSTVDFIAKHKAAGLKTYILSNMDASDKAKIDAIAGAEFFEKFDGAVYSFEVGSSKPDPEIYLELIEKYDLDPVKTIYFDDLQENLDTAREIGMQDVLFNKNNSDLQAEFDAIQAELNPHKENDSSDEPEIQQYLLLDTAGIRKAGQRTLGVETFATYRTVKAVNEADIVLLMFDASTPLTHQDQVVAGIASESKKGLVVILNKLDLLSNEARESYVREFDRKFKFLKVDRVVWISAVKNRNLNEIWEAVDEVVESRSKMIDPLELRKLFNYLMRKKPPQKMTDRKKAVVYDLVYTRQAPPTFELWVRFKETIHWSYTRFLANILAAQFGFTGGQVNVRVVEKKRMNLAKEEANAKTGRRGSSKVEAKDRPQGAKKKEQKVNVRRY